MGHRRKIKNTVARLSITVMVGLVAFLCVFPFLWMLSTSFKIEMDVMEFPIRLIPDPINLKNYIRVFSESNFPRYYLNTILVTAISLVGDLFMTTTAAYAFAKLRFRGKNLLFAVYLATMMVPVHVLLLPRYIMFGQMGLSNSSASIIIPYIFNVFGTFLMRNYFESIPDEILEAARIDGAGHIRTFVSVALPLMKGGIMTEVLLQFTYVWNDYLQPLIFLSTDEKLTLTVGLQRFQEASTTNYALIMAGAVVSLVPIILVFILTQKHLIQSFASAGVKG